MARTPPVGFREFHAERLLLSTCNKKQNCRTFQELSIGIKNIKFRKSTDALKWTWSFVNAKTLKTISLMASIMESINIDYFSSVVMDGWIGTLIKE